MTNLLLKKKLNSILTEMEDPSFYYIQPEKGNMTIVIPEKQAEWISKLRMIEEELKNEIL